MTSTPTIQPWSESREYRLYVLGQTASGLCGVMAAVAVIYLIVLESDGSTLPAAVATALQFLPLLLLKRAGGALVDRYSRASILLVTQTLLGIASAAVALALYLRLDVVVVLIAYSAVIGFVQVIDFPARQVIFADMLGIAGLRKGISLYNTVFGVGRLAAPVLGGLIITAYGAPVLFAVNALSFIFMLASLTAIRLRVRSNGNAGRDDDGAGPAQLVLGRTQRWQLLVLAAAVGGLGYQFATTLTLVTSEHLQASATVYGVLSGVLAGGGILGNAHMAKSSEQPTFRSVMLAGAAFGATEAVVLLVGPSWLLGIILLPTGYTLAVFTSSAITLLQGSVVAARRGKAMAAYNAAYIGFVPLGLLGVGWVASSLGPLASIYIPGFLIATLGALFAYRGSGQAEPRTVENTEGEM